MENFPSLNVYLMWECISKSDRGKQHFHTNQEILIAGRYGTSWRSSPIIIHDSRDYAALLQNGQANTCANIRKILLSIDDDDGSISFVPCQNDKKMTDLTVQNLSTGSKGVSKSRVAK